MSEKQKKRRAPRSSTLPVVVGIGASAGGLESLRTIFSKINEIGPAAFVVVQHMSPTSKSMLTELIARETKLNVHEANDGEMLQRGQVYVTPPNVDITIVDHRIKLADLENRAGPKPSIDKFFSSLAEQYGESSIAVVLSGTGGDGAQGLKSVKSAGGVTIVQSPESAKYDGMPRAALATGAVDLTLTPQEIATEISAMSLRLSRDEVAITEKFPEEPYKGILGLLSRRVKVDFNLYKHKTIMRRILRRVSAVRAKGIEGYYHYLKQHPDEVRELFDGILISVTSFFRDKQQFETLKAAFVEYLEQDEMRESIRIWSAGCATGEEPYSLAILALEALEKCKNHQVRQLRVQIFATDIGENVMAIARRAKFSELSITGIDPILLKKYFLKVDGGYQIRKEVRELVLFARHDLTNDPPFLKMDIISCRNVFIYFQPGIQEKIIKVFHYALKSKGLLFLGKSESIGTQKSFFDVVDSSAKIFQRSDRPPDPTISFTNLRSTTSSEKVLSYHNFSRRDRALLERDMIRNFCPDALVLNEDLCVTAVYGEAKQLLQFPDGVMEHRLEKLIREEVKSNFLTLAHRCKRLSEAIRSVPMSIQIGGEKRQIEATFYYVDAFGDRRIVVGINFIDVPKNQSPSLSNKRQQEFDELERELIATREHLQTVVEEQETSNEELQALNEELQSANEELQSTNEELETSNEELQSTNEELTTLNQELNVKSAELAELSTHLQIVQNAAQSPIIVIDANLNLVSYNHSAAKLMNLNQEHIHKNFRLAASKMDLVGVFEVLELSLKTRQAQFSHLTADQYDFDVFCQPISSEEGFIYGAVLTLVDNSELSAALKKAENSQKTLFRILEGIPAKVAVRDVAGIYTFANSTFCNAIGLPADKIIGQSDDALFGSELGGKRRGRDFEVLQTRAVTYADEIHPVAGVERIYHTARVPFINERGEIAAVCSVGIDISGRAKAEKKLREFQLAIASAEDCFAMYEIRDSKSIFSFGSESLCRLCELSPKDMESKSIADLLKSIAPNVAKDVIKNYEHQVISQNKCALHFVGGKSGDKQYFELRSYKLAEHNEVKIFLSIFDVTSERTGEIEAKRKEEEYARAGKLAALGEMAAGIAHELKTPLNTIQAYVDLIKEYRDAGTEVAEPILKAIENIEATVTNISDVIVGLKSISRSSHDEGFAVCTVKSLLDDVQRICSFHIKNKGMGFDVEVANPNTKINAKPTQLLQVLINLINNGIDATSDSPDSWLKIRVSDEGPVVEFRVIDSGKGIPASVARQIMTPFFTTKQTGTGLGLSLSRNIAKLHGGSLEIDRAAANTTFVLRIPRIQDL